MTPRLVANVVSTATDCSRIIGNKMLAGLNEDNYIMDNVDVEKDILVHL